MVQFLGVRPGSALDETGKVVSRFVKEPIVNAGSSVAKAGTTGGRAVLKTATSVGVAMAKKTKEVGAIVFQSSKSTGIKLFASSKDKIQKAGKLIRQKIGRKNNTAL